MAAASLWPSARRGSKTISASAARCKRVRFRKSDCRKCLDTCPDDAISLNPGPTLGSSCSECGLCQTACPTGVFRDELRSERYLLDRAGSLLDQLRDREARLLVHCHEAETPTDAALSVTCLGSLSESFLVGAALSGFDEIALMRGDCSGCRLQAGEELLRASMRSSRTLLTGLGLGEKTIRLELVEKRPDRARGRKELFSFLARRAGECVASAAYQERETSPGTRLGEPPDGNGVGTPAVRESLRRLVAREGRGGGVLEYSRDSPWGVLRIDEQACTACGVCVDVCPTVAMSQAREGEEHVLSFDSGSCTNCGLCSEACPATAISFEDQVPLAEIFASRSREVARIGLTGCVLCGDLIPAQAAGGTCATCAKRGAWSVRC